MERASAAGFFSPPGRRNQRDEGASLRSIADVAPSSDPSGHLLPGGEKKRVANVLPNDGQVRVG